MMYRFTTEWRKGAEHHIPDALSRAPVADPTPEDTFTHELESSVQATVRAAAVALRPEHLKDPCLSKLAKAAGDDPTYQELVQAASEGFPKTSAGCTPTLRDFWKVRDDLTCSEGLVLKGCQIVVPRALRRDVLADLHASHQGIDRTKRRARQTVYWPGINNDVRTTVEACEACQRYQPSQQRETLRSDPLPTRPFEECSADLVDTSGGHFLVYVDRYSGWPVVSAWRQDPTAQQVVNALLTHFATYGVPIRLKTDGGPQFTATTFREFTERWNITQSLSSPHHPQGNGHAEAGVKAVQHLIRKSGCKTDLSNEEFVTGLLEWRNTPKAHGCSPAQLLYGRSMRTKLPSAEATLTKTPPDHAEKRKWIDSLSEARYNARAQDLPKLRLGQKVKVQDHKTGEWDQPGVVTKLHATQRSYLIRLQGGRMLWRNRIYIRPIPGADPEEIATDEGTPTTEMASTRGRYRRDQRQGRDTEMRKKKTVTFEDEQQGESPPPREPLRRSTRQRRKPERLVEV